MAKIGQWFLWGPEAAFFEGKLIRELDNELAITFALCEGHHQDAAQVVCLVVFLSREVPNHVVAHRVMLAKNVEVKGVDVIVQRLVVEEELGYQTQVLAVDLLVLGIDLEERDRVVTVYLVSRRVPHEAALGMPH
jgi:hypothetical protein